MNQLGRNLIGATLFALTWSATPVGAQATKMNDTTPVKLLKPGPDLITQEMLQSRTFSNAWSAIEALRGNWLRARNMNPPPGTVINPGTSSPAGVITSKGSSSQNVSGSPREDTGIQVYLDGSRVGGLETLKTIPTNTIYSMRRISGIDAQTRFGIGHSDGVIFIATGPNKGG